MKKAIFAGLLILAMLQGTLWFGQSGLLDFFHLQHSAEQQLEVNKALLERNAHLAADVVDLKEGLEAVEEHARDEMGLIKDNEKFYEVPHE